MSDGAIRPGQLLAFAELTRQIAHYNNQKSTWMYWYFSTKAIILVLGAAIPVLTTMNAWPWVIAIVGGTIAVSTRTSRTFSARCSPPPVLKQSLGLTMRSSSASTCPSIVSVMSPQWVDGASFEADLEVSNLIQQVRQVLIC